MGEKIQQLALRVLIATPMCLLTGWPLYLLAVQLIRIQWGQVDWLKTVVDAIGFAALLALPSVVLIPLATIIIIGYCFGWLATLQAIQDA